MRWTGAQIWRQLPEINILCTTVGTGGGYVSMTALLLMEYLTCLDINQVASQEQVSI